MNGLETQDLSPRLGTWVKGIDLSLPLERSTQDRLQQLLSERKVLLFRQGEITVEQQIAVLGSFGRVINEAPTGELFSVASNVDETAYIPNKEKLVYHADYQFTPYGPLQVISLYGQRMEQPEPTNFVDVVAGVDRLPPALLARMEQLNVVQMIDYSKNFSEARRSRMSNRDPALPDSQYPHCTQPMIQVHPKTGKRFVNVSQMQTSHVEGWSDAESDVLFEEIEHYIYAPENRYTHAWQAHDLVIWDNIALQHGREAVTKVGVRELRRVVVNPVDGPTMMLACRPDPTRFAPLQWHKDEKVA